MPQQTIRHTRPAALAGAYAIMREAINRGGLVQCGVLSGVSHDHSAFPTPEHYVMAFAHGMLEGLTVFLCWDPDDEHGNIAETRCGPGFTLLFARADGMSTAINAADLADLQRTRTLVFSFGDHRSHTTRHAYQVYYVQTLPL